MAINWVAFLQAQRHGGVPPVESDTWFWYWVRYWSPVARAWRRWRRL